MDIQSSEKVETLVSDILEMCEKRGLTIEEASSLPRGLKIQLTQNIERQNAVSAFKVVVPS